MWRRTEGSTPISGAGGGRVSDRGGGEVDDFPRFPTLLVYIIHIIRRWAQAPFGQADAEP